MDKYLIIALLGLVTVEINCQMDLPIFGRFFLRITNQTFGRWEFLLIWLITRDTGTVY